MGMLDGRVAIVTGAGRGIGRGEAIALAREGARVIVNDLGAAWDGEGEDTRPAQQVVDEIEADGGEALASYDDVASWEGARNLVQTAVESFGRLDILVNNAGILRDKMSFNMSEEEWDAVINVHLKGHFAPAHFAAAHWREQSKAGRDVSGRIINTTSESGLFGNPGQANYAAAKAGIAALTVVLARELQRFNVTVNAIAPRARTRMTEGTFAEFGKAEEGMFDLLHPDNIAPFVTWLATDAAAHVSGQLFIVWGAAVQVVRGFEIVGTIDAGERRWDVAELTDASKELFARRDPGVPPFGVPTSG
jgi:NAD(P)-dependent dehydrogenase (short-subunit alcohol dehydrogenase family)